MEKLAEFSRQIEAKMKGFEISNIYNADQIGVNYEYVPTAAVNKRGGLTRWTLLQQKAVLDYRGTLEAVTTGDVEQTSKPSDGNVAIGCTGTVQEVAVATADGS
ncbi:uncharacterized protein IUM83_12585 [Phytophthora cinnamomi]|uniref:uncharacterized protein n=1 Tax=Phytophthora cinnamomi TaxID=4785 RepID=UPI00355A92CE|nr:hypothetical protein IUM83_12585 [Phytophthora cinnamomi]